MYTSNEYHIVHKQLSSDVYSSAIIVIACITIEKTLVRDLKITSKALSSIDKYVRVGKFFLYS